MREKTPIEKNVNGIIQVLVFILVMCVPLIFVRSLHDSFAVPKRALAQFLIFEMFLLWLMKMTLQREYKIVRSPLYGPLFLFLAIEALSLVWAENRYLSFRLIWQDVAFGLLVVVVMNCVRNEKMFRRILVTTICTATVVAILGFFQYFNIDIMSLFQGVEYTRGEVVMFSTIGHYNFLAAYLNSIIPSSLMMIVVSRDHKKRILFAVIFLILIFTFLLTKSRGAWLGWIVASAVLCFGYLSRMRGRKRVTIRVLLPSFVIGVIVCLLLTAIGAYISSEIYVAHNGYTLKDWTQYFVNSTSQRAISTFNINTGSALHRRIIWIPTLRLIGDNVLTGVGKNNFQVMYPNYSSEHIKEKLKILTHRGTKVHNEYLQIFAEMGLFGLLAFLFFLYILVRTGSNALKLSREEKGDRYLLCLGLLAGVLATLVHSLVSHPLRLPASSLHFWLLTGFIGGLCYHQKQDRQPVHTFRGLPQKRKRMNRVFIVLILMAMVLVPVFVSRPIVAEYYIKKGDMYKSHERYDEALVFYKKACSWGCRDSEVFRNIGRSYFQIQNYDAAIEYWQKDLTVNPHFPQTYYYLGSAHFRKGEFPIAEAMLLKALEIYPGYPEVRRRLKDLYQRWGMILEKKRQTEEAIRIYRRALRLFEDEERFHVSLGHLLYENDQAEDAIKEFKIAIQRKPDFAEAYRALGYICSQRSEPQRAVFYYERYLLLNPDDPHNERIYEELRSIKNAYGLK